MKIFLDDSHWPFAENWIKTKTVEETIDYLIVGDVEELSLDHNLGTSPETGEDILDWLISKYDLYGFLPPKFIQIHSCHSTNAWNMYEKALELQKKVKLHKIIEIELCSADQLDFKTGKREL